MKGIEDAGDAYQIVADAWMQHSIQHQLGQQFEQQPDTWCRIMPLTVTKALNKPRSEY